MKVLLVDDEPLVMAALRSVIRRMGDGVTVVGVPDWTAATQLLREDSAFDLSLLSVDTEAPDGCDDLADMRRRYPLLPVVVLSRTERTADVIRLIDMGAMGFVPKRADGDEMYAALAMVMSGGVYIPPILLGLMRAPAPVDGDTVPAVMRPSSPAHDSANVPLAGEPAAAGSLQPAGHAEPAAAAPLSAAIPHGAALQGFGLTPRQSDVLALLLKGLPNKLIAREMNLALDTVKDHVAAVLRALGVTSRTQAVLVVSQMGLTARGGGWQVRR